MIASGLGDALGRLAARSASAVVARSRIASPALNAALLRRLSAHPGDDDSLLADPVFEAARIWRTADASLGELAGNLLHPGLVDALDLAAADERMPRDRRPYRHQYDAWVAARDGLSFLVTAGTGSGKTECFMIPMLDGLLRDLSPGRLGGIRAIIIYPLNALIESQRERLAAWTEHLKDHLSFAMYNRLTPESRRGVTQKAAAELADRQSIRETPPSIMVTNITMLEYLLLRAKDRSILERSQGQLRWIVLDEAHSYAGAQAAEMALLLRRVRAAFGVSPEQVQLMATSATISDGADTRAKLERFVADLGGHDTDRVRVIEGAESQVPLPSAGRDEPLAAARLTNLDPSELWATLAPHPRIRQLRGAMQQGGIGLQNAARLLFGSNGVAQRQDMQTILDAAALATAPGPTDERPSRLLPWRVSLFHRALGGVWACIDPDCPHRDPELAAPGSGWFFGGVWLRRRDRCKCEAPSFEVVVCNECGTPHLRARCESGMVNRLVPMRANELDEFLVDAEPDLDGKTSTPGEEVLLRPAYGGLDDRFVNRGTGELLDNGSPEDAGWTRLQLIEDDAARGCCKGAHEARLAPVRYGPAFFLGNTFPILLEALASPMEKSGLPSGGRRSLSFSDSRQGTARLAAKLQQESERSLTRAFLYHTVQERRGPDPEERALIERRLEAYRRDPIIFAENIEIEENKLKAQAEPVPWDRLVEQFASQSDLRDFAGDVWQERMRGGRQMAEEPAKLAEMFLYRELFRRPKVQNNPETMGLLRLIFPVLEQRARANTMPSALREAGVDSDGWIGLVAAAIDFGFRDNLAVDMPDAMVRWVAPRGGALQGICAPGLAPQDRAEGTRAWPTPKPLSGNPSRLVRLVYALTGGDWDNRVDQDRASEVLSTLWRLITESATRDVGRGAYRLDFRKAAITRLEKGWLCPVTRRIFGYAPGGRSPYDAARPMENVRLPILPIAKPGGLDPAGRAAIREWCAASDDVAALRAEGLWTNVHDRVAEYPSFLRAQEHSAQIPRPVLRDYEAQFKDGRINVLNCTTTMEMGVDIPDVTLVVNGNVPPSISNYRQRIGRAGRRGEPFAFAATFCRDLPWDESAFDDPSRYLRTAMAAPAVRLDSPSLVARHVNAALLGAFLRSHSESVDPRSSTGAFFGACDDVDAPISADAAVQSFLTWLRGDLVEGDIGTQLAELTRGTALEGRDPLVLAAATAEALEVLLARWGAEYGELLSCAVGALDPDVKAAFANRAKRMRGEFLLGELARRGFTPAYGFPVDVVQFDHLSGHHREHDDAALSFGEPIGAPSRTLDVAIREYAPGAEVVVDGLVHLSEGVLPAWRARADASGLEDLQLYWECSVCRAFGVSRLLPELCPACATPQPRFWKTLRPAGFLGRRAPHTGYENLGHVPYETSRV